MTALLLLTSLALGAPQLGPDQDFTETSVDLHLAGEPAGPPVTDPDELRERSTRLSKGLRCPVCQGLSSADSQAESAIAIRVRVEKMVAAGYSDLQIRDYFVTRYGEWVLLAPPKQGRHLVVWLAPLVALGLGGLAVGSRMLEARRPAPAPPPETAPTGSSEEEDPYKRAILDELED